MHTQQLLKIGIGVLALILIIASASLMADSHNMYTRQGRVADVDQGHETVVVEVPLEKGQQLTVGGPLVHGATLRKNDAPADLAAFRVGDRVAVTWTKKEDGLYINKLIASQ